MRHSRLQPQTMHSRFQASMRYIWRYKYLYLLLLPAVLYFLIFHYLPMYGVIISFKDFNFKKGILGSEWIGLENFEYMFGLNDFTAYSGSPSASVSSGWYSSFPFPSFWLCF